MRCDQMATSYDRGWKTYFDGEVWRYSDNDEFCNGTRSCFRCGRKPTPEGYDACLGKIDGIKFACCGHGVTSPSFVGDRRVPVQGIFERGKWKVLPGTISYEEHFLAWEAYQKKWHSHQSADRIAERGGFDWNELVEFLGREPETWRSR